MRREYGSGLRGMFFTCAAPETENSASFFTRCTRCGMKKIMIVDDAVFMQKATSAMLSHKYKVICASSGAEAMALYEKERPDMILTDLVMPEMTGLELQQKLQERYKELIPIMVMTADENEDNESRTLQEGAMDYIRKPFRQDVLLRRVDNIMRYVDRIAGLKIVATTDPMTGLLNKASSREALTAACRHNVGALMMIDLDSFKLVNDLYGHGMGDKILIRFAEILKANIRAGDVAGRLGGDEFIAFCKEVQDEAVLQAKAAAINVSIYDAARELMGEDMGIPLGVSVGAVLVPDEGTDYNELFQKADKALYQVKQNGKRGFALYRGEAGAAAAEEDKAFSNIDTLRVILEERNRGRGAFELGQDAFQTVYRFVVRSIENYRRIALLAQFTLKPSVPEDMEEIMRKFGETLNYCMRRSDVYCRSGKRQYAALLSEVEEADENVVLQRILDRWKQVDGGKTGVSYESRMLRG